jgi:hypothetical protein
MFVVASDASAVYVGCGPCLAVHCHHAGHKGPAQSIPITTSPCMECSRIHHQAKQSASQNPCPHSRSLPSRSAHHECRQPCRLAHAVTSRCGNSSTLSPGSKLNCSLSHNLSHHQPAQASWIQPKTQHMQTTDAEGGLSSRGARRHLPHAVEVTPTALLQWLPRQPCKRDMSA